MPKIKPISEDYAILGDRVRERRMAKMVFGQDGRKRSMSQQELADLSGIDKGTISRIERQIVQSGSINILVRFAVALECSLLYLIGLRDDHGPIVFVNARSAELIAHFDRLDERGQLVSLGILREAVEVFEKLKQQNPVTNGN